MLLPQGSLEHGSAALINKARRLRFHDSSFVWNPAGLLAGKFAMARQILAGIGRGATSRVAADRARVLHAARDGTAWPAREIVASVLRSRLGLHLCRTRDRIRDLQFAVCHAAA